MAKIDKTADETKDICWARGDSAARGFVIQDSDGVVENIAGRTYRLTVNTDKNPDPGTELFTVTGVIVDAATGKVGFAPTTITVAPGKYFYDLEETVGGLVDTRIKGRCEIEQDISK